MAPANDTHAKRPKKACTQCRQQKARCDAHDRPDDTACTRCQRLGLDCAIIDGFEREHKRRKLYQLQNETQELRNRLRSSSGDLQKYTSGSPSDKDQNHVHSVRSTTETATSWKPVSLPRMLDGTTLESDEVDALFTIFFHDYSPRLPILDPSMSPNEYYEASPCLFWAIIGVASRKYEPNPELLVVLPSKIIDLILSTKTKISIWSIQALLLVLTWPFPRTTKAIEPTFLLNGTLLHMCMHIGLHTPTFSQDFCRDKLDLSKEEIRSRAMLWANCVLTYQRSCAMKGSPSMPLADITLDPEQRSNLLALVPNDLQSQLYIQDLLIQCATSLTRNGLQTMSKDQEQKMEVIIQDHLGRLELISVSSPWAAFSKSVSRLIMYAFHFYKAPHHWASNPELISQLLHNASQAIELLGKDTDTRPTARTWYSMHGLLQVNCALFRIYKTPSALTLANGQEIVKVLYKGIALLKEMSVESQDLPGRAAHIFTQLLVSTKVFLHPGSDPEHPRIVPLRIRSRMGMSHILDVWVWWREEFGGSTGLYPTPLKDAQQQSDSTEDPMTRDDVGHPNGDQTQMVGPLSNNLAPNGTAALTGPVNYPNSAYQTNIPIDTLPITNTDPFLPDDVFTDIWSYWPDEDWGVRGLS